MVAALLRALGYGNVFTAPPAARLCCEPLVVAAGEFARDARLADGTERGALPVGVTVCCDDPRDAEADGAGGRARPAPRGLDGAGRRVAPARRRGGHGGAAPAGARRVREVAVGLLALLDD